MPRIPLLCPPTMNKLLQFQIIAGSIMSPSSTRTRRGGGKAEGSRQRNPRRGFGAEQSQCGEKKNFLIAKSAKLRAKTENRTQSRPRTQSSSRTPPPQGKNQHNLRHPTHWLWLWVWPGSVSVAVSVSGSVAKSTAAAQDDAAIA